MPTPGVRRAPEANLRLFDVEPLPSHESIRPAWPPVSEPLRVLVCGSRNWSDYVMLHVFLIGLRATYQNIIEVIEGEAEGADRMARAWAEEFADENVTFSPFPADWATFGKGAGPIRNAQMLAERHPNLVVAFSDALGSSRGTADMVRRAVYEKVPVVHLRMVW